MMVCSGASQRVRPDPISHLLAGFDIWRLDVDRADTELLVAKQALIMRRHVVFDQVRVAIDSTDQIRLVTPSVKIAVSDLSVIIGPNRVVALADVHEHMDVVGKVLRWPY